MKMPENLQLIERPIVHVEHVDKHVEDYVKSEFMLVSVFFQSQSIGKDRMVFCWTEPAFHNLRTHGTSSLEQFG